MMRNAGRACPIGGILLVWLAAGCSAMQPLDSGMSRQEIAERIDVGDQVEIRTGSGESRRFHITAMSATQIEAGDEVYTLDEIEIVGHRDITPAEKGTAVAAGIAIGAGLWALFWAVFLAVAI